MSIRIQETEGLFTLETAHTMYQMKADETGVLHGDQFHIKRGNADGAVILPVLSFFELDAFPEGVDDDRDTFFRGNESDDLNLMRSSSTNPDLSCPAAIQSLRSIIIPPCPGLKKKISISRTEGPLPHSESPRHQ